MSNAHKGEWYMLILALLESWFPIVLIFAYRSIEPIFAYSITVSFATLFCIVGEYMITRPIKH